MASLFQSIAHHLSGPTVSIKDSEPLPLDQWEAPVPVATVIINKTKIILRQKLISLDEREETWAVVLTKFPFPSVVLSLSYTNKQRFTVSVSILFTNKKAYNEGLSPMILILTVDSLIRVTRREVPRTTFRLKRSATNNKMFLNINLYQINKMELTDLLPFLFDKGKFSSWSLFKL